MCGNTPTTSGYETPNTPPEYGVMCEWDKGHALEYLAHRPVVTNNFGVYMSRQGVMDSLHFYVTEAESEAAEIARRRGVRYVATTRLLPNVSGYCSAAGIASAPYVDRPGGAGGGVAQRPDYFKLIGVRLHERDGLAIAPTPKTSAAPRLEHFRLIYEATAGTFDDRGLTTTPLKIFEFVPGARLTGKGPAGLPVSAVISLTTNTSRELRYEATGRCATDGTFSILIPYPTRHPRYPVQAEGDCRVTCGALSGQAAIEESAVERGEAVGVSWSPAQLTK